jgi:hypothetical protein
MNQIFNLIQFIIQIIKIILIQKWFLLQNIKDSLLNRNDVFNNGKLTFSAVACLVEFQ